MVAIKHGQDFNSNDASVHDDDLESLSSESEAKFVEDADMDVPVEIDAEEVPANFESDEVPQPKHDEEI